MDRNDLFTIITAFWCLPIVMSICNDHRCLICRTDGYCLSCSPGFWGYKCLYTCPDNCDEAGCEPTSGYCFKCKIGWYGPTCQQECNRCENEQCKLHKCSTGCKYGYVEDVYNNVSYCLPCPPFCKHCSNTTFCNQCYTGYYINQYAVATGIVATCLNCSSAVPKCVDCTFNQNQVSCGICEPDYVVNQYNQCVTAVACFHCQNACDSEGLCYGECKPGWVGPRCSYQCRYACETCVNQDACLSCKDGLYTQSCTVSCNTNCQSGNYPRCRFVDGYCSNGCNKGFWGDQCEYNCNNNCLDIISASELCHRNGTCYYGCKSGYIGSDCSQVISVSTSLVSSTSASRASTDKHATISETTSLTETKPDVNTAEADVQTVSDCRGSLGPAIGGSIAGGFVFGALAAALVFYMRERTLREEKNQTQSKNTYYNVSMASSHDEQSQSEGQLDRNDITFASASRQCDPTLYEKLSEHNKGNLYDHLSQPSENDVRKEVGKLRSNVEYYNN